MYEAHYQLKTRPFTLLPDPDFLYLGKRHQAALNLLEYGLVNGSAFMVMTGEPGTGKTTLLNRLLSRSDQQWTVGNLINTHEGMRNLLPWIAAAFGLETAGRSQVDLFHDFARFLERELTAGRRVLLVLDEAQNVGPPELEELRLLSNLNDGRRRCLQILFSGQPRLRAVLKGPGLEQLAQRISVEYALEPLDELETINYIAHRVQVAGGSRPLFSSLAGRIVFCLTGGNPRLINQVCDHALVYGYAAGLDRLTASAVLETAQARSQSGLFPFHATPGSIELMPEDLAAEAAEVATIENPPPTPPTADVGAGAAFLNGAEAYQAALALKQAGEFARACALFDRLVSDEAWAVKALAQKGLCLKAAGRYDEAIQAFRSAVGRCGPSCEDHVSLRYLMGRTLEAMGRMAEATEQYRAIKRNGRGYRDAGLRLGRLEGGLGGDEGASPAPRSWLQSMARRCSTLLRATD